MSDTHWNSINPAQKDISLDGKILDVNAGALGDADTSYTYFGLGLAGFNCFSMQHVITATTLTYEATDDNAEYADAATEMIQATNDRSFAGAGDWVADGTDASVDVAGGVLDVLVGDALTGAKLDKAYFYSERERKGFEDGKRYTGVLTLTNTVGGTVSVFAGTQLIASGLTDGAAQSFTFYKSKAGEKLSIVGNTAAMTFTVDDVSIKPVAATWNDITSDVSGGAVASYTISGYASIGIAIDWSRVRVKRVTTNATNALELNLTRTKL